jgi:hypothetical protein
MWLALMAGSAKGYESACKSASIWLYMKLGMYQDDDFSTSDLHQSTALDTANTMSDTVGWMRMPLAWGDNLVRM